VSVFYFARTTTDPPLRVVVVVVVVARRNIEASTQGTRPITWMQLRDWA
jgi:hypothetical protein